MAGHIQRTKASRNHPKGGWEARWQVSVAGRRKWRGKTFVRKADAQRHLSTVQADISRGDYVDPQRAATKFSAVAEAWLAAATISCKPKTMDGYRSTLHNHVMPEWSDCKVGDIDYDAIQRWIADMSDTHSAALVRGAYKILRLVLGHAVIAGKLRANPCGAHVRLPKQVHREMHFLTADEVEVLAAAITSRPRRNKHDPGRSERPDLALLVRFAAYTGLRAGEIAALRVKHVDLKAGTLRVVESVSEVNGHLYTSTPKTRAGSRTVALPAFLTTEVRRHLGDRMLQPEMFVFTSERGTQLRYSNFRNRFWRDAVRRADLPSTLRFHDLRHTYASLLVAQGAHPKEMAELLGHSSAQITLDRYSHIMPGSKERIAERLNAARFASTIEAGTSAR
jgi:integrase